MCSVRCASLTKADVIRKWSWALLALIFASNPSPVFPQPTNIYTFSGDVDLGVHYTAFVSSGQHYIGARGDTVYVVTSNGRVWCQKSTDGGQTFGLPVLVDWGYNPSMRVDTAGVVYVAYQDVYADIRFSKSTDGGMTFTLGVKVNDDTMPEIGQEKPTIAVNNRGQIFIAWRDQRTAPGQPHRAVFAAASYDGGSSFSANVQINDSTTPMGGGIDIAVDGNGHIYVAWDPYQGPLILSRSDDSGKNFMLRTAVSDGVLSPSIAVGDRIVGIVWDDVRSINGSLQFTLRFSVSTDYGLTFSPSVRIDDDSEVTNSTPKDPSLVFKNNSFFVSWREPVMVGPDSQRMDVFFSYSSDTGKSFARNIRVNPDGYRFHAYPSIAVSDSGKVYVAWLDARNDPFYGEDYHTFVARGEPNFIKGDLNLDLLLSITDVVTLLNAVFLQQSLPAPFGNADVNCDGFLGPADVVLELKAVFKQEPFPC